MTTVQHAKFMLRFSDLSDIEASCKEDEERRAARFMDWLSSRITQKCAHWVDEVERFDKEGKLGSSDMATPWWDEVRRCAEGEHTPVRSEGWNHPVASEYQCPNARGIF